MLSKSQRKKKEKNNNKINVLTNEDWKKRVRPYQTF